MNSWIFGLALLLSACSMQNKQSSSPAMVSMQVIDRNGFQETISGRDRLEKFGEIDFMGAQPYEKVLRVFSRNKEGKVVSFITTYHPNGQLWQYLEIVDGRAHGQFLEWHPNGKMRLDSYVIDGLGDVDPNAQRSWLFDKTSRVWNEEGILIAEILYENGKLEGTAKYYHDNGSIAKEIPYRNNLVEGLSKFYDQGGIINETIPYEKGEPHGIAKGPHYEELYKHGNLQEGTYLNNLDEIVSKVKEGAGKKALFENGKLASTIEYMNGAPQGLIQFFDPQEILKSTCRVKGGKKNGEEIEYYPGGKQPKLSLNWYEDMIQGQVKSWYENGVMESQREMSNNKKHGLSFAWYKDGQLMLMEEYDQDQLVSASYYKKGDKSPVSKIENGSGSATLFDPEGYLLKKINYEKGRPTDGNS